MDTIRCVNRKTGFVSVYEKVAYTDPETNEVRYRRKYIGHEHPLTGELIQSSGKRGRKKAEESIHDKSGIPYKDDYELAKTVIENQKKKMDDLKESIAAMETRLAQATECIDRILAILQEGKQALQ